MDKKKFIEIFYNINLNRATQKDIIYLLECYCLEFNKPKYMIDVFIQYISMMNIVKDIIQYPINYYKRKFNICTITNKENIIISIF